MPSTPATPSGPPPPAANPALQSITLQPGVKDLSADWNARSSITGASVTFTGQPALATGDLIVLQGRAFRVTSVSTAAGQTSISVAVPEMRSVIDDIVLNGTVDVGEADFVPATEAPLPVGTIPLRNFKRELRRGFLGVSSKTSIGDSGGLTGNMDVWVGGKIVNQQYSAKGKGGSSTLELVVEVDAVARIGSADAPADAAICPDKGSAGTLRWHLGTLRFPVSGVFVEVPLCVAAEVDAGVSMELLRFKGAWQVTTALSSGAPTANVVALETAPAAAPADDVIDATQISHGSSASLSLGAYLELGVRLSALGMAEAGAAAQLGAVAEGTFNIGVAFSRGTWAQANVEPELCIKVQRNWKASARLYASFLGQKAATVPFEFRQKMEGEDIALGFGPGCAMEVEVIPAGTWLAVGSADARAAPATLPLVYLGQSLLGKSVELLVNGSYFYSTTGGIGTSVSGVFLSAGGAQLAPDFATAVRSGPVTTPNPCGDAGPEFQAGDSPADFAIGNTPAPPTRIAIPPNAASLAFAPTDCFFRDNSQASPASTVRIRLGTGTP